MVSGVGKPGVDSGGNGTRCDRGAAQRVYLVRRRLASLGKHNRSARDSPELVSKVSRGAFCAQSSRFALADYRDAGQASVCRHTNRHGDIAAVTVRRRDLERIPDSLSVPPGSSDRLNGDALPVRDASRNGIKGRGRKRLKGSLRKDASYAASSAAASACAMGCFVIWYTVASARPEISVIAVRISVSLMIFFMPVKPPFRGAVRRRDAAP